MSPERLVPWVALFAALLLLTQLVWLLHLTFISSSEAIFRDIYCKSIVLPMFFFARAGWDILNGRTNSKIYLRYGSIASILIGFGLMLFGSMNSIAIIFTILFSFFAGIAGCLALILMKRKSKKAIYR